MRYPALTLCSLCALLMLPLVVFTSPPAIMAQGPGEVELYSANFDDGAAPGWELEDGWRVADGALCGEGHKWAWYEGGTWGDFRVQFRAHLQGGTTHMNYRSSGAGRYFIGFNAEGLYLAKQVGDEFFELTGTPGAYNPGEWYDFEIAGEGGHILVMVNGEVRIDYTDPDPVTGGGIAFETLDDGVICIDDVVVYGPPPPTPTPTPTPDTRFTWVRTGGPLGGLGYDIRMRPDNLDVMFVTDAWAGVHKSTDGGKTWFPANDGITVSTGDSGDAIPIFCLTIDPHDNDVVWAGTQNTRGIFKSTDGGENWTQKDKGVEEFEGITFRGITVDPEDPDVVYAAGEVSSWAWAGEPRDGREFDMTRGVVYKTTDGGENWRAVWRGDNLARYVWVDPRDTGVLYVSTGIFDREAANSVPDERVAGGVGVVKSTDGGETWEEVNDGLNNLYVGTLFMHPENPDILLAGAGNNQYYEEGGVYISRNGGESWQKTLPRDDNITSVEFAESDPEIAYAASTNFVYRSEDGGGTWQKVSGDEDIGGWGSPGVLAGFPIDLQVDPRDPDRVFANAYGGGNFLSEDGGATWSVASKGYTGAQTRDIAVAADAPALVFAAARSGIFASRDGGDNWVGIGSPPAYALEWNAIDVDPTDSQHIIVGTNWGGHLLETRDGGESWRLVKMVDVDMRGWRAIAFAPSDPSVVYAGTGAFFSAGFFDDMMDAGGVYVSRDGGASWAEANDANSADAHVSDIAVHPADPQTVYIGTTNRGLLKSEDGGESWANLPAPPNAISVAVHTQNPEVLFAGLVQGGVYVSRDGGDTWQPTAAGLNPEATVRSIVFDPTDPQVMYVSDLFSGVYRSENGGETWSVINNGLRTRSVQDMEISRDGAHLYAATEGEGVFRLDLSGEPPEALPTPTPTPSPEPTTTNTPIPEEEETVEPTATPLPPTETPQPEPAAGKGGICGSIVLPLILTGAAGMVWMRRRE